MNDMKKHYRVEMSHTHSRFAMKLNGHHRHALHISYVDRVHPTNFMDKGRALLRLRISFKQIC